MGGTQSAPQRTSALDRRPRPHLTLIISGAIAAVLGALVLMQPVAANATVRATDLALGVSLESSATLKASAPDVTALAGIVQTSSGKTLWARNPDQRRAPASTAKVMTALIALRSVNATELVSVSTTATTVAGSRVGLIAGRRYTAGTLIEAMLVASGCDAAVALAEHVAGSEAKFVGLMNAEAARLGLSNTRFVNSSGLDASGAYVSSRDLLAITREAMKSTEFRRVVRLRTTLIDGKTYRTTNRLLDGYPGCVGGKTGTTSWSGHTLVARAARGGGDLYVVVMGSPTDLARYQDAARLLDWGVLNANGGILGSYTTVFDPAKSARISNIARASAALEGKSIPVGYAASFNGLVGERTAARGYLVADTVVGGSLVPSLGGGVCQVSTTLFNAALLSGVRILERRPHSMYLSTYPAGRDATVSWGGPDLKFGNDTGSSLKIRALASGFTMTAGLAGSSDGSSVTLTSSALTQYAAMPTKYVTDATLAPGVTRVVVKGQPGLTCTVVRTVHRPSGSIKSTTTYPSTYPPIARVIAVAPAPASTTAALP